MRVPDDLRPIIGKREITKALGTGDRGEAVERVRAVRVAVDGLFRAARRKLAEQRYAALDAAMPGPSPDAIIGSVRAWLADAERRALATPALSAERDIETVLAELRADAAALRRPHAAEDPGVQDLARGTMAAAGYGPKGGSEAFCPAAELAARAGAERARRAEARLMGSPAAAFDPAFADVTVTGAPARHRATTFGELVGRYVADPSREVSPKTRAADRAAHAVLTDILGAGTPLTMIDRDACRRVQSTVRQLPANFTKQSPKLAAEKAAERAERLGLPRIAAKTANTYLGALAALYRFAEREGLVDRNPARGLLLAGNAGSLNRRPFRIDELRTLFAGQPYPGGSRDAEFWLPLLGLFRGARLNELCQLDLADGEEREGVLLLVIRENVAAGKRLKTRNAMRVVPLHSELARIGLVDRVGELRRRGATKLFPELRPAASGDRGRVARPFGFALTDPGRRLSRTRLVPEVTRIGPLLASRGG